MNPGILEFNQIQNKSSSKDGRSNNRKVYGPGKETTTETNKIDPPDQHASPATKKVTLRSFAERRNIAASTFLTMQTLSFTLAHGATGMHQQQDYPMREKEIRTIINQKVTTDTVLRIP